MSDGYKTHVTIKTCFAGREVYVHLGNVMDFVTQHRDGLVSCGLSPSSNAVVTLDMILESLWQTRENKEQGIVKDINVKR